MGLDVIRHKSADLGAIVARGFGQYASLSDHESNFLAAQATNVQRYPARSELIAANSDASAALFLLSGWACRARSLSDGRRQIIEFLLPGDIIGFSPSRGRRALAAAYALTAVSVSPASNVYQAFDETSPFEHFGAVRRALEKNQEIRLINQIVRAGRQTAYERLAHLLLEFHDRLARVGLAKDNTFPMPLTQEILADGLGLSVVHVNRTLQQLRREQLLTLVDGTVTLLEPATMARIADFQPLD